MIRFAAIACAAALLSGCATAPAISPDAQTRQLVLEKFFAGRTVASGSFVNAITGAERRVNVLLDGKWNGKVLKLFEDFTYADGERVQKTWFLTKTGPNTYSGTREDVVGTAIGVQDGALVRLSYDTNLAAGGSTVVVHFEDVLELRSDGTLLNKAVISKLGVRIGDVTLVIRHPR